MIICLNCDWSGDPSELVSCDDGDVFGIRDFSHCPYCEGKEFEEEEEEEDDRESE